MKCCTATKRDYTGKVVPQEDHVMTIIKAIPARNDEVLAFWQCQAQWQRAANDALANFYC
jgi:hypothetical protein